MVFSCKSEGSELFLTTQWWIVTIDDGLTWNLVDLGALLQDLVGQFLSSRQHLSVVLRYQVLHELLQLLAVHLQ